MKTSIRSRSKTKQVPGYIFRLRWELANKDRQFFEANPGSKERTREFVAGENWPDPKPATHTKVLRTSSTMRRQFFNESKGGLA